MHIVLICSGRHRGIGKFAGHEPYVLYIHMCPSTCLRKFCVDPRVHTCVYICEYICPNINIISYINEVDIYAKTYVVRAHYVHNIDYTVH